jgi:N-acetylglutamate synthase and related acetyltransferases
MGAAFTITTAYDDLDAIRALFTEYAAMLDVDLSFQNYDEEFAGLPGKYSPPDGGLFIAKWSGEAAGCAALRRFDESRCELKRTYVRPAFRGFGLGRMLVDKAISTAREIGYAAMVLDTKDTLEHAIGLYKTLGFAAIHPYYHNPFPNVVYMQLDLT